MPSLKLTGDELKKLILQTIFHQELAETSQDDSSLFVDTNVNSENRTLKIKSGDEITLEF